MADGAVVGLCSDAHCHGDGGIHGDRDDQCPLSGALPVCEGHAASGRPH